jgi:lipoprotein-releasing system ATP-binding protein
MNNGAQNSGVVMHCDNVTKSFGDGIATVHVLNNLNLTVNAGETVAIVGQSGSGKSTLLHILGGLDLPSSGVIFLQGKAINKLSPVEQGNLRNQALGFVYQFHHLLNEFSALENVAMPLRIRGMRLSEAHERAAAILNEVGLSHRVTHVPGQLSGGERQRVAIARALVTEPACVLADEPTGNLDRATADAVFELILTLNAKRNAALIMVTHDRALATKMSRVETLQDGHFVG